MVLVFRAVRCGVGCAAEGALLQAAVDEAPAAARPAIVVVGADARARRAFGVGGTGAIYLIDRRGDERVGLTTPLPPAFLADDLRVLAAA